MNYYPFDSRNTIYRNHFGALAEGETLRLRVLLHKDALPYQVYLQIKNDNSEFFSETEMTACEYLEDYRFYECEITLTEGLYWYAFRYTSAHGEFFIRKTETSLGIVSTDGAFWQQTVYDKDFETPDFLKGGIIYQIFPDRFYNSGSLKENVPDDRYICENWEKQPEFRQPQWDKLRLGNDYYGGDLKGIEQKLSYLKGLGVSCIYLNPIFEAHSNHRYNTADYMKIDPLLGNEKDLESLVKKAEKLGISIILDGVFSHTGDDSVYFNKYNRYNELGAYQDKNSKYFSWYNFQNFPDKYSSWWGITTLPETNENDPDFSEFITGENGVIAYWLKKGIKGFRLDVADELTDSILDKIRISIKREDENNFLLGEVWEDATNKISYGARRRFLRGKQLDSVMNYPFCNAIINYVKSANAKNIMNTVLSICENYPKCAVDTLMNHIGTHDTTRILTKLSTDTDFGNNREAQSKFELSKEQRNYGIRLLKLASVLQYTLPGVPSLYYGDEAGLEGFSDPFCRGTYPWGKENQELLNHYTALGKMRRENEAFKTGEFLPVTDENGIFSFKRKSKTQELLIFVNATHSERPVLITETTELLLGEDIKTKISPFSYSVLKVLCD